MRRTCVVAGIAMLVTAAIGPGSASAGVWRVQSVPTPVGTTSSALNGVSCPGTRSCMGVGSANVAGTQQALADQWGGFRWRLRPISNVPGAGALTGVSCLSRRWCMAVGTYYDASGAVPFAETWKGNTLTFGSMPQPTGSTGESLAGVSCTATNACAAVGSYTDANGDVIPVAEGWNGTNWSAQTVPNLSPMTTNYSVLRGVSCVSATSCSAGGEYDDSDGPLVLAVSWDGSAWNVDPTGFQEGSLAGVSCATSTSCTGAGVFAQDFFSPASSNPVAASGSPGGTWGALFAAAAGEPTGTPVSRRSPAPSGPCPRRRFARRSATT